MCCINRVSPGDALFSRVMFMFEPSRRHLLLTGLAPLQIPKREVFHICHRDNGDNLGKKTSDPPTVERLNHYHQMTMANRDRKIQIKSFKTPTPPPRTPD